MEAHWATATRVVIVDDDTDVRELVSQYLTMQGIVVVKAACEAELLAHLDVAPLQVSANGELDASFSLAVFKTFFDAAPDAILIVSADSRIVAQPISH